jgi:hypothetical protein
MKHKHSEIIKAYIEGIECEFYGLVTRQWLTIDKLETFDFFEKVRIKPEPKPDVIGYAKVCGSNHRVTYVSLSSPQLDAEDNLKLIFDGETGILKSAEVIK